MVVGKVAITRKRRELGKEGGDVVAGVRAVGVAGDLAFAPGREVLVEVAQQRLGLAVKRGGLLLDVHLGVGAGDGAQFLGLALDLGQGFFEVEVVLRHVGPRSVRCPYMAAPGARRNRLSGP